MDMNFSRSSLLLVAQGYLSEQQARLTELDKSIEWSEDRVSGKGVFDPVRIGQVITNFLSSAIKFSPAGKSIELAVSGTNITNDVGEQVDALSFSVRDYGVGIPEAELETIFDKFSQSSATKTEAGGTGLGLPISEGIIKAHQGKIWAENIPGGGAIFTFTIPLENN